MKLETAHRINSAAAWIGLALLGVKDSVEVAHVETIRGVSLAQMETATEIVEAENEATIKAGETEAVSPKRICCVCESRLLANVKAYADAVQI
jgi:hypothetical protein